MFYTIYNYTSFCKYVTPTEDAVTARDKPNALGYAKIISEERKKYYSITFIP